MVQQKRQLSSAGLYVRFLLLELTGTALANLSNYFFSRIVHQHNHNVTPNCPTDDNGFTIVLEPVTVSELCLLLHPSIIVVVATQKECKLVP